MKSAIRLLKQEAIARDELAAMAEENPSLTKRPPQAYRDEAAECRMAAAILADDPEMDNTEGAHPAWWRSQANAVEIMCLKISEILDGKDTGDGVANPPWEPVRRRLIELAKPKPFDNQLVLVSTIDHRGIVKVIMNQIATPDKISKAVLDAREELIREGLIELGWTPPQVKEVENDE